MASPIVNQWVISGYATVFKNVGSFSKKANIAKATNRKGSFSLKNESNVMIFDF